MKETYANFNKYDERTRRLNIFAVDDEAVSNSLKVVYFPCSKHDQFSKKKAWGLYYNHLSLMNGLLALSEEVPQVTIKYIPVIENKPKKSFLDWCNENFYHLKVTWGRYDRYVLVNKNSHIIHLKDKEKPYKLSMYL